MNEVTCGLPGQQTDQIDEARIWLRGRRHSRFAGRVGDHVLARNTPLRDNDAKRQLVGKAKTYFKSMACFAPERMQAVDSVAAVRGSMAIVAIVFLSSPSLKEGRLVMMAMASTPNPWDGPSSFAGTDTNSISLALQRKHGYISGYSMEARDEQQRAEESP
ncbi:MAG: hypothetical protein BGP09_05105 [Rhizobium sp. 60-20]|nr:MAG: hypothetical protein BGP09_05105 [Rhizobium sp. 60-20]